jgi:hypothetical protein
VIVLLTECVERTLLPPKRLFGRLGRRLLNRSVHPLVTPVLVRPARLDPLRRDVQTDQPDAQTTQTTDAPAGERRTVVAANRVWNPYSRKTAVRIAWVISVPLSGTIRQRNK